MEIERQRKRVAFTIMCDQYKEALDELHDQKNGGRVTVDNIQMLLVDKFDCNHSRSGVYTLLDRISIVCITGRSKHPKHFEDAIEEFKASFPEEVEVIKEKIDSKKIEV